ncbi:MAG: hypothetical protein KDB69_06480, partial [Acidimicrobiia bacterium]|nr:hypothetical protein [Acidimicrobiia bacterium]
MKREKTRAGHRNASASGIRTIGQSLMARWHGRRRCAIGVGAVMTTAGATLAQPTIQPGGTPFDKDRNERVDLVSGVTFRAAIDYPGDIDTFTIHADAGEWLYGAFWDDNPSPAFFGIVDLYAPDGTFLVRDADQNGLEFNLQVPMTGIY